eukprot:Clim_evm12s43 gene=Clim_evmTU12s43
MESLSIKNWLTYAGYLQIPLLVALALATDQSTVANALTSGLLYVIVWTARCTMSGTVPAYTAPRFREGAVQKEKRPLRVAFFLTLNGRGHFSQAKAVFDHLPQYLGNIKKRLQLQHFDSENIELVCIAVDNMGLLHNKDMLSNTFTNVPIEDCKMDVYLQFSAQDGVSYIQTFMVGLSRLPHTGGFVDQVIGIMHKHQPDVILNFYNTALWPSVRASRSKVPIITMSTQLWKYLYLKMDFTEDLFMSGLQKMNWGNRLLPIGLQSANSTNHGGQTPSAFGHQVRGGSDAEVCAIIGPLIRLPAFDARPREQKLLADTKTEDLELNVLIYVVFEDLLYEIIHQLSVLDQDSFLKRPRLNCVFYVNGDLSKWSGVWEQKAAANASKSVVDNVNFKGLSYDGYRKDLLNSDVVLMSAGFHGPCEVLSLHRHLFLYCPVGHMEQKLNSHMISGAAGGNQPHSVKQTKPVFGAQSNDYIKDLSVFLQKVVEQELHLETAYRETKNETHETPMLKYPGIDLDRNRVERDLSIIWREAATAGDQYRF